MISAMTQANADHAPQFALLVRRPGLDVNDCRAARRVIEGLVIEALAAPLQARQISRNRGPVAKSS